MIHATVNALRASVAWDAELVYVDDADGPRLRDYEQRLTDLDLTLDLGSRYPDAILADTAQRVVWFVDAVTSDGEIDEVRRQELGRWARDRRYGVAGYVTAYETWRKMANRQGRMKNLAVDSFVWIAEDGGKLFSVRPLG